MHVKAIFCVMGILLMGYSLSIIPPLLFSYWIADGEMLSFLITFLLFLCSGLGLWYPLRHARAELQLRHGFVIVAMFWTLLGAAGSLPFYLSPHPDLNFAQSLFESVSGFTATGATVMVGIEHLPKSFLYYRAQLHFLGGMGFVILAVALMPLIGIGGMALYRAESSGPMKDNKVTPRIAHTARGLWMIYVGLNVACIAIFWLGGMSFFDALIHGFSTVATGGFAGYDASFGYFQSAFLEWVAIVFMFAGGVNFALHFMVFMQLDIKRYVQDLEFKVYTAIFLLTAVLVAGVLWQHHVYADWHQTIRSALFHVISILTTTGYTTTTISDWPVFIPLLLIFLSFIGGCGGSTSGGMKVLRVILLMKQSYREILRQIHPRAILPIKVGGRVLPETVLGGVWAFFALYMFSTAILTLVMIGTGMDTLTAFSAIAACLNVTGAVGLGDISSHFKNVSDFGLYVLTFAMLLGRLEIFTLFVLLTPSFWRS